MKAAAPSAAATGAAALPTWYPDWSKRLAELYFSGTTSVFVLHGNTLDLVPLARGDDARFGTLAEFLAEQLFGRWDLVLRYDLASGLRCLAGRDKARLRDMVTLANQKVADLTALKKHPTLNLAVLDRFVQRNVMAAEGDRVSAAILLDHASFIVPRGDRKDANVATHLVTLLNLASSPYVKQLNVAIILIDSQQSSISERLVDNPHVASLTVPLPDEAGREAYLTHIAGHRDPATFSDYLLPDLAALTPGMALTDLGVMVGSAVESGHRLDEGRFRALKKQLIERQAGGLLEFIEPRWGLDMVVGHDAAKARLREDAELINRGALDTAPMGYLLCGPVGTGKSFLAQCATADLGIPCVKLKNFRSKYVGETESNLERVLNVLRGLGPVVVIIDEADAMLGDRDQGGESGVGSRVFGMIAAQMGDTRYRGKIIWMLLTARPDLLPIDLKRQGRAEVHIPLFYPDDAAEVRDLFVVLAAKNGAKLQAVDVPDIPQRGDLSGADIEGMVGRAWRRALLAGETRITREILEGVVESFMPSTQTLERELQELAAIIECTDSEFLPDAAKARIESAGGRHKLQERLTTIKRLLERA